MEAGLGYCVASCRKAVVVLLVIHISKHFKQPFFGAD